MPMLRPTVLKEANRTIRSCIAGNMTKQNGKLITMGLPDCLRYLREQFRIRQRAGYIYRMGAVANVENTGCHPVSRRNITLSRGQAVKDISDGFLKLRREIK